MMPISRQSILDSLNSKSKGSDRPSDSFTRTEAEVRKWLDDYQNSPNEWENMPDTRGGRPSIPRQCVSASKIDDGTAPTFIDADHNALRTILNENVSRAASTVSVITTVMRAYAQGNRSVRQSLW